jgi:hypothetical protein
LKVRKDEAIAIDDFSRLQAQRDREHGPVVDAGVKLAALSTGVYFRREILQQGSIELAAGKGARQLLRIHARQFGAEAAGNHFARQRGGWYLPEGKQGFEASRLELRLAIGANVGQEKVAKRNCVDALIDSAFADVGHALLIDFIGAWPGQRHNPQGQLSGFGLSFQHGTARAVHGNALEFGVQGGQQAGQFNAGLLAQ